LAGVSDHDQAARWVREQPEHEMSTCSILIIDDCEEDRFLLKRFIKRSGIDTTVAEVSSGQQALEFLSSLGKSEEQGSQGRQPLIAFLDLNMPIMSGWDFLQEYQRRRENASIEPIPIVVHSTSDHADDKARVAAYDCVKTYFVKGRHSPEELKSVVEACLAE